MIGSCIERGAQRGVDGGVEAGPFIGEWENGKRDAWHSSGVHLDNQGQDQSSPYPFAGGVARVDRIWKLYVAQAQMGLSKIDNRWMVWELERIRTVENGNDRYNDGHSTSSSNMGSGTIAMQLILGMSE